MATICALELQLTANTDSEYISKHKRKVLNYNNE